MSDPIAFSQWQAAHLGLPRVPTLVTRGLRKGEIGALRLAQDAAASVEASLPADDAILASLNLRDGCDCELSIGDQRPMPRSKPPSGAVTLLDLRQRVRVRRRGPIDAVEFYLPRATLAGIAEDAHTRFDAFSFTPGVACADETIRCVGQALLPLFAEPERASRLFVDHIAMAAATHVLHAYTDLKPAQFARGGLAPWQEKRAKEMLETSIAGDVPLAVLAAQCELSPGHFARAFRRTTGLSPHQWLLSRRIDLSKSLLRTSQLSLSEIALNCGFSDQSHFTKTFSGKVGTSPAVWRRSI